MARTKFIHWEADVATGGALVIEIDERSVKMVQAVLDGIKNGAGIALSRAINHTIAKNKTLYVRRIKGVTGLSTAFLNSRLSTSKAYKKKLYAKMRVWGKIPLAARRARQQRAGVTALNILGGQRQLMPRAFIANFAWTKRGTVTRRSFPVYRAADLWSSFPDYPPGTAVVQRTGVALAKRGGRGPLKSAFTRAESLLAVVVRDSGLPATMAKELDAPFRARIDHEVKWLIRQETERRAARREPPGRATRAAK